MGTSETISSDKLCRFKVDLWDTEVADSMGGIEIIPENDYTKQFMRVY